MNTGGKQPKQGEFEERNILSMKKDMTQVDDQKEDFEINPLSEEQFTLPGDFPGI